MAFGKGSGECKESSMMEPRAGSALNKDTVASACWPNQDTTHPVSFPSRSSSFRFFTAASAPHDLRDSRILRQTCVCASSFLVFLVLG